MKGLYAIGIIIVVLLLVIAFQLWNADRWSPSDCEHGTYVEYGQVWCKP